MPNMSYVMFQNTLEDLIDCNERLTDILDKDADISLDSVSEEEKDAMSKMMYLINEMRLAFEELGIEEEEV